jgi:hypothetical protein
MERSTTRGSIFLAFGLTLCSWLSLAIGCLGLLAPVAHGEEITVTFDGSIIAVPPPPPGYTVDPEVQVGTPFSGTYTLPATNNDPPVIENPPFSQSYGVFPSTGSMQIGSLSVVASEDPILGSQVVLINNDFPFAPVLGVFDSWTLVPLQSDASSGGAIASDSPHFCQIFFAKHNPPDKLDGTEYFVNDTLDGWGISLPAGFVEGSIQCFAGDSFLFGSTGLLFAGRIENIYRLRKVTVDLKPGSDPNCVQPTSRGSVPVAILGASDLDVLQIDQSSLRFGGAVPQKCALQDQAPADGIPDLTCHYKASTVAWPAPGGDCGEVVLTGALSDGTKIEGADRACLAGEPTCTAGTSR